MPTRILLADDSPPIRKMLRTLLEINSAREICGEAEDGEVAVRLTQQLKPDVVVLDLAMPIMNGLEAARRIAVIAPTVVMLMFTMHISEQLIEEAHRTGICEVFSKSDGAHLVKAIESLFPQRVAPRESMI
jgi:DNA-binding NarL/FixJ family response regulator